VRAFAHERAHAPWSPAPALLCSASERPLQQQDKTATLLSNSQLVVQPLERLVRRACALFAERAYVHQYERHGMAADELCARIAHVEQLARDYAEIGA
jgi:tubulin delta